MDLLHSISTILIEKQGVFKLKSVSSWLAGRKNSAQNTKTLGVGDNNPFSVYRLVGVDLQEEAAEGTALLPRLLLTPQARPARLLPPISMDQKGR